MGCGVVVSSDKRRASKRNAGNCMSAPGETTYAVDKNGCSHDDPSSFQKEEDKKYYEETYRRDHPDKNLSDRCLKCNGDMFELIFPDLSSLSIK